MNTSNQDTMQSGLIPFAAQATIPIPMSDPNAPSFTLRPENRIALGAVVEPSVTADGETVVNLSVLAVANVLNSVDPSSGVGYSTHLASLRLSLLAALDASLQTYTQQFPSLEAAERVLLDYGNSAQERRRARQALACAAGNALVRGHLMTAESARHDRIESIVANLGAFGIYHSGMPAAALDTELERIYKLLAKHH